jgi:hypothetical protein
LVFDRELSRSPGDTPPLPQVVGDDLDHPLKCLGLNPAVTLKLRGRYIFDLFVAQQCDSC